MSKKNKEELIIDDKDLFTLLKKEGKKNKKHMQVIFDKLNQKEE